MSAKEPVGKGHAGLVRSKHRASDPPMLGRKSVLMGMLTSGFVIANAAQPSATAAGTVKPGAIAATTPTYLTKWAPSQAYLRGQQVVSPNNDVVFANVAHTSGSTFNAANWSVSSTFARVFNPRAYGAIGDGTTDDTAAIQAALNAGAGQIVAIPSGTFLFTQLTLTSGVTLCGAGGVLKLKNGTCSNAGTAYYPIENLAAAPNVSVIDLIVDANAANNTLSLVADTFTLAGENQRIEGCTLLNTADSGVMFSHVTNSTCRNNRIAGATGSDCGIYINDGDGTTAYENVVEGNRISGFNTGSGIALKRISSRYIVAQNTIYNCGNGITLEHGSTSSDYSTNVTIVNNRMRNIANTGIDLRQCDFAVCSGNRIEDHLMKGIIAQGAVDCVISGNVINYASGGSASYGTGIHITDRDRASTRLSVTGNVVRNAPRCGIEIANSVTNPGSKITLIGNMVTGAVAYGLSVGAYNTGLILIGNTFYCITPGDIKWTAGAQGWAINNDFATIEGVFPQIVSSSNGSIRAGVMATANRPTAASAGAGAQIYDSTLGKPIWSNGTVWKDAAGTTV